jgi:hypothetical protein
MRRLLTVIFVFIFAVSVIAQNSGFIKWQGKALDSSGKQISNQQINVQVVLHFGSPTAIAGYVENHTPTTNPHGVFKIEIGNGTPVSGSYEDLPWGSQKSYAEIFVNGVKLKTDEVHKPRNYNQFGGVQVNPNAAHTNTQAGNIDQNVVPTLKIAVGGKTLIAGKGISFTGKDPNYKINSTEDISEKGIHITAGEGLVVKGKYPNFTIEKKKHFIGEKMDGGVVFYVTNDGQHGLIAKAPVDIGTWQTFFWEYNNKEITPKDFKELHCTGEEIGAGKDNTFVMLFYDKYNNPVDIGEYHSIPQLIKMGKWFVPSIDELREAYKQKDVLKNILDLRSRKEHIFWSSTEGGNIYKGHGDAPDGGNYPKGKSLRGGTGTVVNLWGGQYSVAGVQCINFYNGKRVVISKAHAKPFFLVKEF